MKKIGIVYLITESPEARGVLDVPRENKRKTYCEEKSLSMSEVYQAKAKGFNPVFRLSLPQEFEYKGETLCEYKGTRYTVLRDYNDDKSDSTELTLARERGNAAAPTEAPAQAEGQGSTPAETEGDGDGGDGDDV